MSKVEAKIWPKFPVTISEKGEVLFHDKDAWDSFKVPFHGKEMDIILKNRVKERSRQEEKYYWAVVVRMVAEEMSVSRQEAHNTMASIFLTVEEKSPAGFRYKRVLSTTELSDKRYDEYIFKECVPWASLPTGDDGLNADSGLDIYLPLPNEIDYENV
ncbi:MAG: hypothetical protein V4481_05185 [Patescibacteria group bacterium]